MLNWKSLNDVSDDILDWTMSLDDVPDELSAFVSKEGLSGDCLEWLKTLTGTLPNIVKKPEDVKGVLADLYVAFRGEGTVKLLYIAHRVNDAGFLGSVREALRSFNGDDRGIGRLLGSYPTIAHNPENSASQGRIRQSDQRNRPLDQYNPYYDQMGLGVIIRQVSDALHAGKTYGRFLAVPFVSLILLGLVSVLQLDYKTFAPLLAILSTLVIVFFVYGHFNRLFSKQSAQNLYSYTLGLAILFVGSQVLAVWFLLPFANPIQYLNATQGAVTGTRSEMMHLTCVLVGLVCVALLDLLGAIHDHSAEATRTFNEVFWYVDVPSIVAMSALLALVARLTNLSNFDAASIEVTGVVVILLTSNLIYGFVAGRFPKQICDRFLRNVKRV